MYYRRPSVATIVCSVCSGPVSGIPGSSVEDCHLLVSTRTWPRGAGSSKALVPRKAGVINYSYFSAHAQAQLSTRSPQNA